MNTAGVIFLIIFILLVLAAIGWVIFTRRRAAQLGLPPPTLSSYIPFRKSSSASPYGPPQPAPGGIQGWINDRIRMFKNRNSRTAAGAYEQTSGGATRSRGFDPDEAWDSRVGHDDHYGPGGYYEEQELGLHPQHADTRYAGSSYPMNLAATPAHAPQGFGSAAEADEEPRGRPRSRSPGLGVPGTAAGGQNPFDDDAEPSNISLRGVSPRPIDTASAVKASKGQKDPGSGDSPSERRSIFRENV